MDRKTKMYDCSGAKNQRPVREVLNIAYDALEERDYNAISQIVGYLISGDVTYITSHNHARDIIGRVDREDVVEELLKFYLEKR